MKNKKQKITDFKNSIKEKKKKGTEKGKSYFSQAKNWLKRKFRKKQRDNARTERVKTETKAVDFKPSASMLPTDNFRFEPIVRTQRTPVQQQEKTELTPNKDFVSPISQTRNINSLLIFYDKGKGFIQFDADDGKHKRALKSGTLQLSPNVILDIDGSFYTVRHINGKIFKNGTTTGKTQLLVSSLFA